MEETKRELVKEGEARPELAVEGNRIIKVAAGESVGRTGDFPGKNLPDWREYSNRCPRKRREWLASMEEKYGNVSDYADLEVAEQKKGKGKGKIEGERDGFSEELEPIPLKKRPARYRRYCLAKFMGKTFDDSESSNSSSDDGFFAFAFRKKNKEEKKKQGEGNVESSRQSSVLQRYGESETGGSSSKSSGKIKVRKFLNKFSFRRPASSDYAPLSVPRDAQEEAEGQQQLASSGANSQPPEMKAKHQGRDRANTFPPSGSTERTHQNILSLGGVDRPQSFVSGNDLSTLVQDTMHSSRHSEVQTHVPKSSPSRPTKLSIKSSQSPSKASSPGTPVMHDPPARSRPQSLPPMPPVARDTLRQVDCDNKDVPSPMLPTPSPSPPKQKEVREFEGASDKGKQSFSQLKTACGARLHRVAHEAAENVREETRRERQMVENERRRLEWQERTDSGAEAGSGVEKESELTEEVLMSGARHIKNWKAPSMTLPSTDTETRFPNTNIKPENISPPESRVHCSKVSRSGFRKASASLTQHGQAM